MKVNSETAKSIAQKLAGHDHSMVFKFGTDEMIHDNIPDGVLVDIYENYVGQSYTYLNGGWTDAITGSNDNLYDYTLLLYMNVQRPGSWDDFRQIVPFGYTIERAIEEELLEEGDLVYFTDINGNKVNSIEHLGLDDPAGIYFVGVNIFSFITDLEEADADEDDEEDEGEDLSLIPMISTLAYMVQYKDTISAAAQMKEVVDIIK
jgi:hypothetical protein